MMIFYGNFWDCQEFENLKNKKYPLDRLSAEDGNATPINRIS